jgi:threonyl-tRNA synthetase
MSIEFVIIPILREFEEYAIKIKDKLTSNITINIHFQIDTNFHVNINSRINKWKKEDFEIIIINQDCIETNKIMVRFSEKGSRLKNIDIADFIELVNSFEDEDEDEDENENDHFDDSNYEHSYESNCIIM